MEGRHQERQKAYIWMDVRKEKKEQRQKIKETDPKGMSMFFPLFLLAPESQVSLPEIEKSS